MNKIITIYVDELFEMESRDPQAKRVGARHGHKWCHMWCEPGDEHVLHAMAYKIGMQRSWFQDKPGFPHYDLVPSRRLAAIREGAVVKLLMDYLRERNK